MSEFSVFVSNNLFLFLALSVIVALILRMELKRVLRGFKDVTPAEAVTLINREDAFVLDVREDNELAQGKIAGAKHIALSVLKQRVEEIKEAAEKPVIAYCKTGMRSSHACEILKQHNFSNVVNLKGGVTAWQTANLPLVKK